MCNVTFAWNKPSVLQTLWRRDSGEDVQGLDWLLSGLNMWSGQLHLFLRCHHVQLSSLSCGLRGLWLEENLQLLSPSWCCTQLSELTHKMPSKLFLSAYGDALINIDVKIAQALSMDVLGARLQVASNAFFILSSPDSLLLSSPNLTQAGEGHAVSNWIAPEIGVLECSYQPSRTFLFINLIVFITLSYLTYLVALATQPRASQILDKMFSLKTAPVLKSSLILPPSYWYRK